MRYVNTIEFRGRKAVINSYSNHSALEADRKRQCAQWKARYPNAVVLTEEMTETDCIALCAKHPRQECWTIGAESEAADRDARPLERGGNCNRGE